MSHPLLEGELRATADGIIGKYPNPRSAALPLLFLAQSVDGYVTDDGMRAVAELLDLTPAEILGTASFYTMLKKTPQGRYLISVCRNISCTHLGSRKLISRLEEHLGVEAGGTTEDALFSLEAAECLATCDGAPAVQINYEDFYKVTPDEAAALVDRLRRGEEVLSVRGEPVKTHEEVSRETATAGLRVPGTAGDQDQRLVGGESPPKDMTPGFRPKVQDDQEVGDSTSGPQETPADGSDEYRVGHNTPPSEREASS